MLTALTVVTWEAIGKIAALLAIFLVARPFYRLGDHLVTKAIEEDTNLGRPELRVKPGADLSELRVSAGSSGELRYGGEVYRR